MSASSSKHPELSETDASRLSSLFESIGLDAKKAEQTVRNAALSLELEKQILAAGVDPAEGCSPAKGMLIYEITTSKELKAHGPEREEQLRSYVVSAIKNQRILRSVQLKSAFDFLKKIGPNDHIDDSKFDKACGVGLEITAAQIERAVADVIAQNKAKIDAEKHKFNRNAVIGSFSRDPVMKFADLAQLKSSLFAALDNYLGPDPAAAPGSSTPTSSSAAAPSKSSGPSSGPSEADIEAAKLIVLTKPDHEYEKVSLSRFLKLGPQVEGQRILVEGWVDKVREASKGNLKFVELRDGTTPAGQFLQSVLEGPLARCLNGLHLRRESSVRIYGLVKAVPKTPVQCIDGYEVSAEYWELVGDAPADLEDIVNDQTQPQQLFDNRHIVLRRGKPAKYMRMRSHILMAMRQHFDSREYIELIPPTLVQTQCEGGATLFRLNFYESEAYLTQSSQLYLETVLPSLGKVFCIAQSYRAEKSRTRRHLCEYTHLEAELPFISFPDLLDAIEDLICDTIDRLLSGPHAELLRSINPKIKAPARPFRRMDYAEAITYCQQHGIKKLDEDGNEVGDFEFGDDIPELPERKMIDQIGEPVFLCRFPVHLKSFYMPKDPTDRRVTLSTDLLMPGVGEVVGGSMRIDDYTELMEGYRREGLDPAPYYWYTDQRKYGTCPHGGYGLGVERFLTWLFDEYHIKNVCTYPRYTGRCVP